MIKINRFHSQKKNFFNYLLFFTCIIISNCQSITFITTNVNPNNPNLKTSQTIPVLNYTMNSNYDYNWIDASDGTKLLLGEYEYSAIQLPFEFYFYNQSFSVLYLSSNGFLRFVESNMDHGNSYYGFSSAYYPYTIAPFWTYLERLNDREIFVQNHTEYWVAEWKNMYYYNNASIGSFEVILYRTGEIIFNFEEIKYNCSYSCGLNQGSNLDLFNIYKGINDATANFAIQFKQTKPEHEIAVTLDLPNNPKIDSTYLVNASIWNLGEFNESNIEFNIYLDDIIVESTFLTSLLSNDIIFLSYIWNPVLTGTYNFTVTSSLIVNESVLTNNQIIKLIPVVALKNYTMITNYAFNWIDASIGHELYMSDDGYSTLGLPFTFTFYNCTFKTVYFSANGYLSFGDSTPTNWGNIAFPNNRYKDYFYMIAPFWDDLNPRAGGKVYTLTTKDYCVIEWENICYAGGTYVGSFQVILFNSGDIIFNYDHIRSTIGNPTCGLNMGANISYYTVFDKLNDSINEFSLLFTQAEIKHDIVVALDTPYLANINHNYLINASVYNIGYFDEINIDLNLYIDGILVNSTYIPVLKNCSYKTITFDWYPTDIKQFNFSLISNIITNEYEKNNNYIQKNITTSNIINYHLVPNHPYYWIDASQGECFKNHRYGAYETAYLPFDFYFYNQTFSKVYISSFGYLSFTDEYPNSWNNRPFPLTSNDYSYMIAPMWMDLDLSRGGEIYMRNFSDCWVVEWNEIRIYDYFEIIGGTFQVILFKSGDIVFNYQRVNTLRNGYSCGINFGYDHRIFNAYTKLTTSSEYSLYFTQNSNNPPDKPNLHPINPQMDQDGIISLVWDEVDAALFYNIYRYTDQITYLNPRWLIQSMNQGTSFTDIVYISQVYYYVVVAVNGTGVSNLSECRSVSVELVVPPIPFLENISICSYDQSYIILNWSNILSATSYNIYRDNVPITTPKPSQLIKTNSYNSTLDWLPSIGRFYYVVTAINEAGESESSNCVMITLDSIPPKKWTILIYIAADNDLERYGIQDINEMESIGSDDNISILVQIDRRLGYDYSNANWTDTRRGIILYDDNNAVIESTLLSLGELNMGSSQTLEEFINWGKERCPAENYMLILWNHGTGVMNGMEQGYICEDINDNDSLTNQEIESAIKDKELDILGFDACLMASIEYYYALKNHTDIFIGAEGFEPGEGWPYDTILNWLRLNSNANSTEFSKVLVDKYISSMYTLDRYSTLSAVKSSCIDNLITSFSNYISALLENIEIYKDRISIIRDNINTYDYKPYVDFYDLIFCLNRDIPELNKTAEFLLNNISECVINSRYRGNSYSNSKGLSIYFPQSRTEFSSNYCKLPWGLDVNWDNFLMKYYGIYDPNQGNPDNPDNPNNSISGYNIMILICVIGFSFILFLTKKKKFNIKK
ncbi:MAG: hypothetical protein JXA99_09485 [Candidatus Lokiarchaeota archaeon]|nr:hypothetical protein [Candidatus Lokiarchaeota archaeon]